MEELLQEIVTLVPKMKQHQEEFDEILAVYEKELRDLFDIEQYNHTLDVSKASGNREAETKDISKNTKDKNDQRDKIDTKTKKDTSGNKSRNTHLFLIKYYNPFEFLLTAFENSVNNKLAKFIKKKLRFYYRKILLNCHPDKWKRRQRKHNLTLKKSREIIQQSKSAYRKEQYGIILYLAYGVGITLHKLSSEELTYLLKEKNGILEKIKEITSSLPWLWIHQPWCRSQIINHLRKKFKLIPKKKNPYG